MSTARKKPARGDALRVQRRDWSRRLRELNARERADLARLPSMPDAMRDPYEYAAWAAENGILEPSLERKQLFEEGRQLQKRGPALNECIEWLLACQGWGAPFDLRTVRLGANPANENARPSKMLAYLTATVARQYPNVTAVELYDAIRNWRKRIPENQ